MTDREARYPIGHWPFGTIAKDHLYHVVRQVEKPVKYFSNDRADRATNYVFLCTGRGATYDYRASLDRVTCQDCLKLVREEAR